jgi:tetratricopeptide (TPR) repeat protein
MKKITLILLMLLVNWFSIAQLVPVRVTNIAEDVAHYSKIYKKSPTPEHAFRLGVAYYYSKEYTKAIIYLSKATVKKADSQIASNAYLYRGITRIALGSFSDGYADLRKSLALNPKNAEVYKQRGLAQINTGEHIKAVQDFSAYAMYADKSWEAFNTLANEILKTGTTNRDLLEKAQDFAMLSVEKEKNMINQQTLNQIGVLLSRSSAAVVVSPNPPKKDTVALAVNSAPAKSNKISTIEVKSTEVTRPPSKVVVADRSRHKLLDKSVVESDKAQQAREVATTSKPSGVEITDFGKIRKAKVWAVVVGISKYTTLKSLNLKYANTDADLFYNFLRSPSGGSIPAEQITLITNEKATRVEILKAMKSTFGKAFDTDVIILYIASHGLTENGEFYFLTTEAEPGYLDATALSRNSVAEAFKNKQIRAKKKLIFADACHSGELMKVEIGTRGLEDGSNLERSNQLLVEMAQTNEGCAMMTASTGSQKSYEDAKWGGGHGIFTFSLVEGLKGKADYDENKIITLNEINEYVFRSVTEATERKQQPSFQNSFDDNFPMGVVIKR